MNVDTNEDELLEEYDFTDGVRGKYAERFRNGSSVVLLEPDVAEAFKDSESVNAALRTFLHNPTKRVQHR